ncbi:hypothetical protein LZ32DRAFT_107216 [Colletotrichum eremochloae]|nr:hypothetical protein LZ32DRAFT_107216 [Colletotrichum eremochloae]
MKDPGSLCSLGYALRYHNPLAPLPLATLRLSLFPAAALCWCFPVNDPSVLPHTKAWLGPFEHQLLLEPTERF